MGKPVSHHYIGIWYVTLDPRHATRLASGPCLQLRDFANQPLRTEAFTAEAVELAEFTEFTEDLSASPAQSIQKGGNGHRRPGQTLTSGTGR